MSSGDGREVVVEVREAAASARAGSDRDPHPAAPVKRERLAASKARRSGRPTPAATGPLGERPRVQTRRAATSSSARSAAGLRRQHGLGRRRSARERRRHDPHSASGDVVVARGRLGAVEREDRFRTTSSIGAIAEGQVTLKSASGDLRIGIRGARRSGSTPARCSGEARSEHRRSRRARGRRSARGAEREHDERRYRLTSARDPDARVIRAAAPRAPASLTARLRRFWIGESVSLFGDQITLIALPLVGVLVLDASAAQMGYLGAAALLPNLLFSLHAGAWSTGAGGGARR